MGELGIDAPHCRFLDALAEVKSNLREMGNGADIFRRFVQPSRTPPARVAAHLAISSLVGARDDAGDAPAFTFKHERARKESTGRLTLATGRLQLERVTTGDRFDFAYAAMHFGGIDFYCLLKPFPGLPRFHGSEQRIWAAARSAAIPSLLRVAQEELGPDELGLDHVLPDGRQRISSMVLADIVHQLSETYAQIYEVNGGLIDSLRQGGFDLPRELRVAAELTLEKQLEREIRAQDDSRDPAAYARAVKIVEDAARRGVALDRATPSRLFGRLIEEAVRDAIDEPTAEAAAAVAALLELRLRLGLEVDLDHAQERLYDALESGGVPRPLFAKLTRVIGIGPRLLDGDGVSMGALPAVPVAAQDAF